LVPEEGEGRWRKGVGGQIWCKYCVHRYENGKMRPVETIPGTGEEGIQENYRRREFNYDKYII
jgi:hypothetical protein